MPLLENLAERFEHLTPDDARAILAEHWGLAAPEPTRLRTERDDTFRAGDVLLKVAHPNDDPALIAMQSAAMAHVREADPDIPIQRVVPTLDGAPSALVGGRVARVLTWLDGDLVEDQDLPPSFFDQTGRMLGRLSRALSDFDHPGAHRALAWDLPQLPALRPHATDPLHLELIDRFETETLPVLGTLPHQVIHNDGHPGNLLNSGGRLAGILDFGDTVYSARVCDLAVAATYLVEDGPRPWPEVDALVAGFTAEVPLSDDELALLPMLMAARTIMRTLINRTMKRPIPEHNDAKLIELMKEI